MSETMKYKLVPVEPTEAMIDAAMNAGVHVNVLPRGWTVAYQAMLAAAPASLPVGEEELARLLSGYPIEKSKTTGRWLVRLTGWDIEPLVRAILAMKGDNNSK